VIQLKILNKRIKNFYFYKTPYKNAILFVFCFNLYLKLYFLILLDFNSFKFVFLDFYNARQVVFFRYDGSIVLTTNRSNKSAVSFRSKI